MILGNLFGRRDTSFFDAAPADGNAPDIQPAREQNVEAFVSYFRGGCKREASEIGIELEHFLVDGTGEPLSYSQPHGVRDILEGLSSKYPQVSLSGGDILGVAKPGMNITIEPAAQIELSAGPFRSLDSARRAFDEFDADIAEELEPVCGECLAIGYDPACRAMDKELIPKARYEFMNEYLGAISAWGPRMMRGSASTQVSIDYLNEADCVKKMRVAAVLAPLFSLVTDNAALFEGAPRPHKMMRTEIWKHCDPDRCNTPPHVLESSFGFRSYAEYILDTPAIVRMDDEGVPHYDTRTFGEIYAESPMEKADIEHALSMVFPDVRLKTYVEIRPADAMPTPYAIAYAALVKGLFYCPACLQALFDSCEGITQRDIWTAKESLMAHGYDGRIYERDAGELALEIFDLARYGLKAIAPHEKDLIDPLYQLAAARTTLADRY